MEICFMSRGFKRQKEECELIEFSGLLQKEQLKRLPAFIADEYRLCQLYGPLPKKNAKKQPQSEKKG